VHLQAGPELDEHYLAAIGSAEWTRAIGILQLFAAGGLCFRRTRVMTAAALAAVLLIAMANQVRTDRLGYTTLASLLMLAWSAAVAWGEARRRRHCWRPLTDSAPATDEIGTRIRNQSGANQQP
jgi:hypothetical protein